MDKANQYSVIIAEDDTQIAEIQRRFVQRVAGFEVVGIAHTTRDALEMAEVLKPDLLMLDIHFPDGSGLDLLRQVRSQNWCRDVIMITAAKEVDALSEALRLGVFDYVLKPLVFNRLEQALVQYQAHRGDLEQSQGELSQTRIDQLLPRASTSPQAPSTDTQTPLPKGIDPLTLDKIRTVFESQTQGLSAERVGEIIGSSRTTARRYLEYLVGADELIADIQYGSVGRPERHYIKPRG